MATKEDLIASRRRRYEELKADGSKPKTLPGPSTRPAPPIPLSETIHSEVVPPGWYWTSEMRAGETLRIACGDAPVAVSMLAWNKSDPSERLNYADTVKVQWTSTLQKGRVIFSDMGRVLFSIIEDSCGAHDALVGGSTAASTSARFGEGFRNTRDNFILAAAKLGVGTRDIPPCITFFAPVAVDPDGCFVWQEGKRTGRDYVELRAEMDLLVALSNCPHPFDTAKNYPTASAEVLRYKLPQPPVDDLCRTATSEAVRGFENNAFAAA